MITLQKIGTYTNTNILEISGLSTDEKPIKSISGLPIINGSIFDEIDTGTKYKYNEDSNKWVEQPKSGNTNGSISLDYTAITNKPRINSVELSGNKTLDDFGIQPKGTYLTKETDPTVPAWAKENNKPTYTAQEVGALPSSISTLPNPKKIKFTGVVTDEYDGSEEKVINIPTPSPVKTGISGADGRPIEIRKGNQNIEYRETPRLEIKAYFNSAGTQVIVNKDDIVTSLHLYGYPSKVKFAKIKTVTLFGADENNVDVANINCNSAQTFDFLGMFNPYNEATDLTITPSILGEMNVSTVIDETLKKFTSANMQTVKLLKKIRLWLQFLDVNKEKIGEDVFVDLIVNQNSNSNAWKSIVSLHDIEGTVDNVQIKQIVDEYLPTSNILQPYMKTVDADKKYALKSELPKQGVAVTDASDANIKDTLNKLLLSLRNAGIISK